MKKCPFCAEEVQDEAVKCKHCQSVLGPLSGTSPSGIPTVPHPDPPPSSSGGVLADLAVVVRTPSRWRLSTKVLLGIGGLSFLVMLPQGFFVALVTGIMFAMPGFVSAIPPGKFASSRTRPTAIVASFLVPFIILMIGLPKPETSPGSPSTRAATPSPVAATYEGDVPPRYTEWVVSSPGQWPIEIQKPGELYIWIFATPESAKAAVAAGPSEKFGGRRLESAANWTFFKNPERVVRSQAFDPAGMVPCETRRMRCAWMVEEFGKPLPDDAPSEVRMGTKIPTVFTGQETRSGPVSLKGPNGEPLHGLLYQCKDGTVLMAVDEAVFEQGAMLLRKTVVNPPESVWKQP